MKFIIFHGSFGNPQENWIPWLKKGLESLGYEVITPQFPIEDWDKLTEKGPKTEAKKQNLISWLNVFKKEIYPKIKNSNQIVFIGHSIAPVFILHVVLQFNIKLERAIFVSPFFKLLNTKIWQFDVVNKTFYKESFDFRKLKKLISISYSVYSDNDPYVERELMEEFADKIDSKKILIKNGGHLNEGAGFKKFPLLLEIIKQKY